MSDGPPSGPASGAASVPECYRHPGRETYIRCTRCDRPICPECMTSAAVGFQCPECVAAGVASTREVRTVVGGRVPTRPTVTITVFVLNVVIYGAQSLGILADPVRQFAMWPFAIAVDGEFYRLLTSAFLHASLLHIGFNMLVLWSIGPTLERILGHSRFIVLYLLSALGGSVASYVVSNPLTLSVGASGAIFGLMGALVVAGRRLGFDITQVLVLLGINVVIGFLPGTNIDWRAHLGGLVTGAVVAVIFTYAPKQSRVLWHWLGCLAVLGSLVVFTMWRTASLRAELLAGYEPVVGAMAAAGRFLTGG